MPSAALSRGAGVPARRRDRGAHRGLRAGARLDRASRTRRGDHRRGAVPVRRHAGRRPQDGLLSRPARQPRRVAAHAAGRRCSTASAYTGAFACAALAAGATGALLLESSGEALEGARRNLELNGLTGRAELSPGQCLRRAPPARGGEGAVRPRRPRPAAVHAAQGGRRGGSARLQGDQPPRPPAPRAGWDLATFSCSHHVTQAFFEEICRDAAGDAGIAVRVLAPLARAGPSRAPQCPESRYLTGLLLQVVGSRRCADNAPGGTGTHPRRYARPGCGSKGRGVHIACGLRR